MMLPRGCDPYQGGSVNRFGGLGKLQGTKSGETIAYRPSAGGERVVGSVWALGVVASSDPRGMVMKGDGMSGSEETVYFILGRGGEADDLSRGMG